MESLAVKYRPQKFEDVCSQESIITILSKQLELKQVKNAYLFCGASGCGKTTVARIFANEINEYQGNPIEIDGASNNGVENVRDIIRAANERSLDSKYKIYIIDECHALTGQAWQAFLKCIEEPPEFTIFIFCTTDPQKIPATILNRVMRFNFTRINNETIIKRLEYICKAENFNNYFDACEYISRIAQGSMRNAISLLEKAANYTIDLTITNVLAALGGFSYDIMFDLLSSLELKDERNVLGIINYIYNQGIDLKLFVDQFLTFCLDIDKFVIFNDLKMTNLPAIMEESIKNVINISEPTKYYSYLIDKILDCKNSIKYDTNIKTVIEVNFLSICRGI